MPKILFKYILKQLAFTTFCIGGLLIVALWLIQSLRFVELILNAHSSFFVFTKLILCALPDLLVLILPIAAFVSILFVYHKLIADKEIVVMETSGLDHWAIAKPTLFFSGILTLFLYGLSVFVSPVALHALRDTQLELRNTLPAVFAQEGVFNTFGNTTVYIHQKTPATLHGIFACVQGQDEYAIMAKKGRINNTPQGPQILMHQGNRQTLVDNVFSILHFEDTLFSLDQNNSSAEPRSYKPYELPLQTLLFPDETLPDLQRRTLKAEGHQRLLAPLMLPALALIALCFLLLQGFSRRGLGKHVFHSVLAAILLESISFTCVNLGAHSGYMIFLNYLIILSIYFATCALLKGYHPKFRR